MLIFLEGFNLLIKHLNSNKLHNNSSKLLNSKKLLNNRTKIFSVVFRPPHKTNSQANNKVNNNSQTKDKGLI